MPEKPFNQLDFNVNYDYIESLPPGREKALQYIVSGLLTDGSHHKQWGLQMALEALGGSLEELRSMLPEYSFEEGIAP